jgi:hypothetical protein
MKPIKLLLLLAIMLAPGLAAAQGYYGRGGYGGGYGGVPGGFHNRTGRLAWGIGIGVGGMHDDGSGITNCDNCSNAPALELDGHIGGMIGPRFALLFEAQLNARTVHNDTFGDDTTLSQTVGMLAGQFWITPQLWIKGGIGVAGLQADSRYVTTDYGTGGAIMGAIGFELMSARFFALDLQGRIIEGTYNSGNDNITAANIGLGFNWY